MKMEVAGDDVATLRGEIKELEKQQTLASQNREKDGSRFLQKKNSRRLSYIIYISYINHTCMI